MIAPVIDTVQEASVIPPVRRSAPNRRRIRPAALNPEQVWKVVAAAVSSGALVWLVYFQLTPASGGLGFALSWYLAFLLTYWLLIREQEGSIAAGDRTVTVVITSSAILLLGVLGLILGEVVVRGLPNLRLSFFTTTMAETGPLAPATEGGALHSIVGTLEQVGLAVIISVPLAILTAIYLNEIKGRWAKPVRIFVNAMSGIPPVVAGLFLYALWVLRFGFSGFAAALALSILMLPTVTRTTEEVLRLVPQGLREASLAMGSTEWRTTWKIVLPTARPGLITAVLLGVARAVGDTAVLIFTAGGLDSLNLNPFSGQQDSLPLFIFKQVRIGLFEAQTIRAWTGAFVLVVIVLVLFTAARMIGRPRTERRRKVRPRKGALHEPV